MQSGTSRTVAGRATPGGDEERAERYAGAIALATNVPFPGKRQRRVARAVMVVADAEQAELRAEVERLRSHASEAYEVGCDQGHEDAHADGAEEDRVCRERKRAEAAEAALAEERAKALALADEWDQASDREREMADRFGGYHAGARSARMKASDELRAALAGPAPEATERPHPQCHDDRCAGMPARLACDAPEATFEAMLADPVGQYDPRSEVLASIVGWTNAPSSTMTAGPAPAAIEGPRNDGCCGCGHSWAWHDYDAGGCIECGCPYGGAGLASQPEATEGGA